MADVTVDGLVKTYDHLVAVDDVSFTVRDGAIFTLLGPSGCGKTTVLRCIAGHEKPDGGEIRINDRIVYSSEKGIDIPPHKRNIGMVFQSYALWPHLNTYSNIAYGLQERKWDRNRIEKRVKEQMIMLGLEGLEKRYPSQLSGGQQQRVALGRALAYEGDALLLDEPLSNLDARLRERMRLELKQLQKDVGITTIYVTHANDEALMLSDMVAIMKDGRIVGMDEPRKLYLRPPCQFVADFIGLHNSVSGRALRRVAHDTWIVKTSDDTHVHCVTSQNLKEGDEVGVFFGPTDIDILAEVTDPARPNVWRVRVLNKGFVGEHFEYEVQLAGNVRFRIKTAGHDRWGPPLMADGEDIYVHVDPALCRAIRS